MTTHAGQTSYDGVELLPSEEGMDPSLFFTERDRRQATRYLRMENPVMPMDLLVRLTEISETPYGHQASFFINQLHEKARNQGDEVISQMHNKGIGN